MDDYQGYLHPQYASSFGEFGEPMQLPASKGWVLNRRIPGGTDEDAMGCYPIFCCPEWSQLHLDLQSLTSKLVCLSLVTDPFADVDPAYLETHFDMVKPFKSHFVFDANEPVEKAVSKHHRYYARRALKSVVVEVVDDPLAYLDAWLALYGNLTKRHGIKGIRAFSRRSFEVQLQLPGMVMLVARLPDGDEIAGAHLMVLQGDVAYSHLAAFSDKGYEYSVAYGVFWESLRYVAARGFRYLDVGAAAGISAEATDGLSRFKKGWSNTSRLNYFCGQVLDPNAYRSLCRGKGMDGTDYFPPYRFGEFN